MGRLELVSESPSTTPSTTPSVAAGVLHLRPADRSEPWIPGKPELVNDLARVASVVGLDLNLSGVLIVERALIAAEFEVRRERLDSRRLDSIAAATAVAIELSAATADYLRTLNPRTGGPSPSPTTLRLPMRLGDRILRFGLEPLLRPELLTSALAWERASALAGHTMTEWVLSNKSCRD
jgi:hypothetical protein